MIAVEKNGQHVFSAAVELDEEFGMHLVNASYPVTDCLGCKTILQAHFRLCFGSLLVFQWSSSPKLVHVTDLNEYDLLQLKRAQVCQEADRSGDAGARIEKIQLVHTIERIRIHRPVPLFQTSEPLQILRSWMIQRGGFRYMHIRQDHNKL